MLRQLVRSWVRWSFNWLIGPWVGLFVISLHGAFVARLSGCFEDWLVVLQSFGSLGGLTYRLGYWLGHWLVYHLNNWLVDWFIGSFVGSLVVWLVGSSVY